MAKRERCWCGVEMSTPLERAEAALREAERRALEWLTSPTYCDVEQLVYQLNKHRTAVRAAREALQKARGT